MLKDKNNIFALGSTFPKNSGKISLLIQHSYTLSAKKRILVEKPWIRTNDTNSPESEQENQNAKEAYRALKTISLRRSDLDEYKNFEARVKERAEKKYNYSMKTGKEYEVKTVV